MAGTEAAFKCFDIYFNFYSKIFAAPYKWNKKSRKFSVYTGKFRRLYLYGLMAFGALSSTYGASRLLQECFLPDPRFKAHFIIMYIFYVLCLLVSTVINAVFFFNGKPITNMINSAFKFDLKYQRLLCPLEKGKKPVVKQYERILRHMVPATSVASIFAGFFSLVSPMDPLQRFLIDYVPELYDQYKIPIRLFACVAIWVCAFYVWSPIILLTTAGIIYMNASVFWLTILSGQNEEPDGLRARNKIGDDMELSMKMYQALVIMTNDGSQHLTLITLPVIFAVAGVVMILCNFASVTMYDTIPMPGYLFLPLVSIICHLGFGFGIPHGAQVYESAREVIHVYGESPTAYFRKRARALRPVAITVGPFFKLHHGIPFSYFGETTNFSIDLVMTVS